MPSYYGAEFDRKFREMVKRAPTDRKVRLRTAIMEDLGHYYPDGTIMISRGLDMENAIDTVIHEYAHHLQEWDGGKAHTAEWGRCFAKAYNAWHGDH